jgi:L-malate glycosyltransferase
VPGRSADCGRPARQLPVIRSVCLFVGQLGMGGAEKEVVLLAAGLSDLGVEVEVLTMYGGGPRERELRDAGIPVRHLNFSAISHGWRAVPHNVAKFWRLLQYLRQIRPEVLHCHLFPTCVIGLPAARLARVPILVASQHTPQAILHVPNQRLRLARTLEKASLRRADCVIAVSGSIAGEMRNDHSISPDKIEVILNALPDAAYASVPPAHMDSDQPVVLCVANLYPYKGHRYLLDACARLAAREVRCTLVLIGDGPELPHLRRQAHRLGIDVRFLGTRRDVRAWLERADVVAQPSLAEALGISVMEAMAARRPIVASRVGGMPELLAGRGLLVPPGDAELLADALQQLLADHELAGRLADDAQRWAQSQLRLDGMVSQHAKLYQRLLYR